jgi:hypothetical protein
MGLVLKHGTRVHNGGALFVFMRGKDIPGQVSPGERARLEGITLVMVPEQGTVITAYKNRQALKVIKRKQKRHIAQAPYLPPAA